VKEFLSHRGFDFEEKDIRADHDALRELVGALDSRVTPTLVVDGRIMKGFLPQELEEWLSGAEAGPGK